MKRSREEFARSFDEKADRYDRESDELLRKAQELVVRLVEPHAEDVILDIGCGTGTIATMLAPRVKRVIGIDISEKMLDHALTKTERFNNVSLGLGSFQSPEESFDLAREGITKIVSNYALHCLDAQEKRVAIERMADLLPAGGTVVLGDVMFFEEPHRSPYDSPMADPASVRDLLAMFRLAGMVPEAHPIHPAVGVIRAVVGER